MSAQVKWLIIFSVIFININAQYNDTIFYNAAISSSGTYNQTNTNQTYLLNNILRLGLRKKNVAVNIIHKYLYGKQGDKVSNNDFTGVWDLNLHSKRTQLYYWGLLTYNKIYSLRVNSQVQTGAGLAYDFWDEKKVQFNVSDGILYDFSDVQLSDTVRDVYQTIRNSLRVQYRLTLGNISLRTAAFIQNSFEYKQDYIIKSEATLSYRFKKYLSLTVQGNYNKFNRTGKETLFLTYGLSFETYF